MPEDVRRMTLVNCFFTKILLLFTNTYFAGDPPMAKGRAVKF
jgi:hypothetical protein